MLVQTKYQNCKLSGSPAGQWFDRLIPVSRRQGDFRPVGARAALGACSWLA